MKKKILAIIFLLTLFAICQSQAATTYTFEIADLDYVGEGIADENKIIGFESNISGTGGVDWVIGTKSSPYDTEWSFDEGGMPVTLFGGTDTSSGGIYPLNNGTILTIIAPNDTPLTLSNFFPYDINVDEYTGTITASLNQVPIPGSILLLGSGLVGLIGLARRKRS